VKRLGILHVKARNGLLVLKSLVKNPVKTINAVVYRSSTERVGVVVDVIGRVDEPYIVVKPDDPALVEVLEPSTVLYYHVPRRKGVRRRPGRRGGTRKKSRR